MTTGGPGPAPVTRPVAEPWARVWRLAAIELLLTAGVLFVAVSSAGLLFGEPSLVPALGTRGRLTCQGLVVACAIAGAMQSRLGRHSGGHLSPAITASLWVLGLTDGRRVAPYLVAQLGGSLLGAAAAGVAWGSRVRSEPVSWGLIGPAPGVVLSAEAAVGAGLIAVVWWVVRRHPAAPLPWVVGGSIGLQIVALGAWTGGSGSPARQFGPLVLSGGGPAFAADLVGPLLGGLAAAALARLRTRR